MFRAAWIVLLALLIAGCATERPKVYEMGHAIQLGPYVVAVETTELWKWVGRDQLVVHFGVHSMASPRDFRPFFMEYRKAFTLRDGNGKKYKGYAIPDREGGDFLSLEEALMNTAKDFGGMLEKMGIDPERWVAVFMIPAGTRGYKLHIENEMRQPGQAGAAEVDLRR